MSVIVIVNSYKIPPGKAIRWCQDHMPNRWSRHSVPSADYQGMWEYSKTAYMFDTKEDALLFKLNFPGAKISNSYVGPGFYYDDDKSVGDLLHIKY